MQAVLFFPAAAWSFRCPHVPSSVYFHSPYVSRASFGGCTDNGYDSVDKMWEYMLSRLIGKMSFSPARICTFLCLMQLTCNIILFEGSQTGIRGFCRCVVVFEPMSSSPLPNVVVFPPVDGHKLLLGLDQKLGWGLGAEEHQIHLKCTSWICRYTIESHPQNSNHWELDSANVSDLLTSKTSQDLYFFKKEFVDLSLKKEETSTDSGASRQGNNTIMGSLPFFF